MTDESYFRRIEAQLAEATTVAERARSQGRDPEPEVEIPAARDMADRVEKLLEIDGVAELIRELEGEMSREEAALEMVEDFVAGNVGNATTKAGKIEDAVRTAVALLTEGVVAAPIEGIDLVEVVDDNDGTQFVNVYYAGPIRSAGGTAQALSVLVADYARSLLGISQYEARDDEVRRYAEEVALYDRETGLQYSPSDAETKFVAEHMPIMLDGEATGDAEVSGYRDLERIDTNNPRGGMCLVLAEGIALKAPKIQRYTSELDEVDWPWLRDLIEGEVGESNDTAGADADAEDGATVAGNTPTVGPEETEPSGRPSHTDSLDGPPRPDPSKKYLRDLIAGRPVFGHPGEAGGFRLRYGRSRNHGFATAGIHPATMHLVDDFLATGTQIKTERPGKAAGVVPVDAIEGPTVRLANGDVRRIDDPDEALAVRNGVDAILDLGEYLVNYGEFVENNHSLAPASYTVEWWVQEFERTDADVRAIRDATDGETDLTDPAVATALDWATEYDAPLHPAYTYLWHDISVDQFRTLADTVSSGRVRDGDLLVSDGATIREILEALLVEHAQPTGADDTAIRIPDWQPLARSLGLDHDRHRTWDCLPPTATDWPNAMKAVNAVAPFTVRERAPTRIGSRMGRPEKSESRELSPTVHTLFPVGEAGGAQRDIVAAANHRDHRGASAGKLDLAVGRRVCGNCDETTFANACPTCGAHTRPEYRCPDCERVIEPDKTGHDECPRCDRGATAVESRPIDVKTELRSALDAVGERETAFDVLKGVKGLSSTDKVPEPIEKGILRAKHDVSTFKDGTVRYDMTDLPVTAVRPAELDVTADTFRELGYEVDIHGDELRHNDQLIELNVQDVVLSEGAAEHMMKTADFVDQLLTDFYGLSPFYDVDGRGDLVGELVFGLAPHTSAATVARVVGFTSAAVGYAHPYFHAAKRRNCFHPDTEVWYRDENEDDDGPGEWHHERIATLVDDRLTDPREDDFGTQIEELRDGVLVPSITEDGTISLGTVTAVSKHVAPDHMIAVETGAGRSITVTPDHSMLRWSEDGQIERVPARSISVGDQVPGGGLSDDVVPHRNPRATPPDGGHRADRDEVIGTDILEADTKYVYCLTVNSNHTLVANDLYVSQCDGDEDCVLLLMDALLNFSKCYLPDQRGGSMDAPLVMSSRVDPSEIDDEAHNVDIVDQYPLSFYQATREMTHPGAVDIELAADRLDTDRPLSGFSHTHDTTDIALGPDLSAYKTLEDMQTKMESQLEIARKVRSVDERDVAERIIEYHFLPDLLGNLRAFSSQEVRCLDCGEKFRRMPLTGHCRACGGDVNLTVHEGSVTKYLDTATMVAEEYGAREYTKQRLEVLERSIESVFEDDTNKQSGIADFM